MRVILVDDEIIALEVLSQALKTYEDIDIVGVYTSPEQAIQASEELEPDVVFLDIEMGEKNGILAAGEFKSRCKSPEIVFVTAYSDYAIEAFELNAIDYLLKPIQKNRLARTIERLRGNMSAAPYSPAKGQLKIKSLGSFTVTDDQGKPLKWRTKKSKELFAYLWLHKENPVSKDLLIEEIFCDKELEKATTLLHTNVYQLRKNLEKLGYKDAVNFNNDSYQLDLNIESDLAEVNRILKDENPTEKGIERLVRLYQGSLLLQEDYPWLVEYPQIIEGKVMDYCSKFVEEKLLTDSGSGFLLEALRLLCQVDPYNDEVALLMIDSLGKAKSIKKLQQFYQNYCKTLREELGLEPAEEITAAYQKVLP